MENFLQSSIFFLATLGNLPFGFSCDLFQLPIFDINLWYRKWRFRVV